MSKALKVKAGIMNTNHSQNQDLPVRTAARGFKHITQRRSMLPRLTLVLAAAAVGTVLTAMPASSSEQSDTASSSAVQSDTISVQGSVTQRWKIVMRKESDFSGKAQWLAPCSYETE